MSKFKMTINIAVAVISTSAIAHEGMHGPGAELDSDGNGALTLNEFYNSPLAADLNPEMAEELFAAIDLNQDSYLSSAEYLRALSQR